MADDDERAAKAAQAKAMVCSLVYLQWTID
jgi:hypothetical protein